MTALTKNQWFTEATKMKITRLLPKFLAKEYQNCSLNRLEAQLEYHAGMARACEEMIREAREELDWLEKSP